MQVTVNKLKTKDHRRVSYKSTIEQICKDFKLTPEDKEEILRNIDSGFVGIYQVREENEEDNINYLYISYFAPEQVKKAFYGISDCFITK